MLRRVIPVGPAAAPLPLVLTAARRWLNYTEQSSTLEEHAARQRYRSNVWVTEGDMWWVSQKASLHPGEEGIEARLPRRVELYNAEQVDGLPDDLPPVQEHTSFGSRQEYRSKNLIFELEQRFVARKLESRYWVSSGDIRRHRLQPKKGISPFVLVWSPRSTVFNAEQFTNPGFIETYPTSGSTGNILKGLVNSGADAWFKEHGFKNGLCFTAPQLTSLGLELVPESKPFRIVSIRPGFASKVYNISALEDLEAAMGKTSDVDPNIDHHAFLFRKKPMWDFLTPRVVEFAEKHPAECASKLWFTDLDAQYRHVKVKPDAPYLALGQELSYYNVSQMTDPSKAFAKAGSTTH